MKVCVSVCGRFHAFYLAQQLYKRGLLNQLITSYPKFEVAKYGIPDSFVSSILSNELFSRGWNKLPLIFRNIWNPQFFLSERYDRLAASRIKSGADIFVGWSSFSLRGIRRAKKLGMITVLERGSSHIVFQRDILKEEYAAYRIKANLPHPRIVEKELEEYKEADYIEVPSTFAKASFIEQGISSNKIIFSSRGVNINQFNPIKKNDNVFRLIYCGGLTIQKGVHYLLKSFYELKLSNSELWLIGSPSEEISSFLKKYNSANILLKGKIIQSKLYEFYSQGSLFCLPSIQDGFGVVILQAMACGLPVICTTNTAGYDVVKDGIDGFVIPIRDVNALKEKIVFMYENQARCKEMGQLARQRVQSEFTWDKYGDRIISELNRILKHK